MHESSSYQIKHGCCYTWSPRKDCCVFYKYSLIDELMFCSLNIILREFFLLFILAIFFVMDKVCNTINVVCFELFFFLVLCSPGDDRLLYSGGGEPSAYFILEAFNCNSPEFFHDNVVFLFIVLITFPGFGFD